MFAVGCRSRWNRWQGVVNPLERGTVRMMILACWLSGSEPFSRVRPNLATCTTVRSASIITHQPHDDGGETNPDTSAASRIVVHGDNSLRYGIIHDENPRVGNPRLSRRDDDDALGIASRQILREIRVPFQSTTLECVPVIAHHSPWWTTLAVCHRWEPTLFD